MTKKRTAVDIAAEHFGFWVTRDPTSGIFVAESAISDFAEAAIVQQRFQERYLAELIAIIVDEPVSHARLAWEISRATPEQRCRAALRAVGVEA